MKHTPAAATQPPTPANLPHETAASRARLAPLLLLVLALQACVVVPATREVYDPECKVMKRQMTLQTAALGSFQSCADDACKAMLVAMGAVTAATAVVSGSVALVGNMVFWFERQGQCPRPVQAPADAASAASRTN